MDRVGQVAAQAKINLALRVLAREVSGYHQIETLFCRIALADTVILRLAARERSLDCRGADLGPIETNLAYRAAAAYAAARGWPAGFAIEIEKRIPVGGGLGGGSADAGAVLRILHALDPAPPLDADILALAQTLGADVPFMTLDEPFALAWGRGDRLLPLAPLPPRPVLLLFPPVAVATRDAYGWLELNAPGPTLLPRGGFTSWSSVEPHLGNDFEPAVIAHYPEIGAALAGAKELRDVRHVHMSGSGSTIFALLDSDSAPLPSQGQIAGARVLLTSTVNHVAAVERVA